MYIFFTNIKIIYFFCCLIVLFIYRVGDTSKSSSPPRNMSIAERLEAQARFTHNINKYAKYIPSSGLIIIQKFLLSFQFFYLIRSKAFNKRRD